MAEIPTLKPSTSVCQSCSEETEQITQSLRHIRDCHDLRGRCTHWPTKAGWIVAGGLMVYLLILHSIWFGYVEEEVARQTARATTQLDEISTRTINSLQEHIGKIRDELSDIQQDAGVLSRYQCREP